MARTRPWSATGRGDRLSKLDDRVIGHVLSFLPAKEAARTAMLSSRWRDIFAAVHTVSLEEPEPPIPDYDSMEGYDSWGPPPVPVGSVPPPFVFAVSNVLLARNRRGGAAPLRALRVAMDDGYQAGPYRGSDCSSSVDQWVSYALQQAAPEGLRLDLRLRRAPLCGRAYSLRRSGGRKPDADGKDRSPTSSEQEDHRSMSGSSDMEVSPRGGRRRRRPISDTGSGERDRDGDQPDPQRRRRSNSGGRGSSYHTDSSPASDESVWSDWSDDDAALSPSSRRRSGQASRGARRARVHTVSPVLFSCASLRSLSLGHCRLAPPTGVALPLLETLLLSHVSDPGGRVECVLAGCPRLADLTLEACREVVQPLYVPRGARLRRLALRCCHSLAGVALDASELEAFEYRGAVPGSSLLTLHGGGARKVARCKVDICGEEVSSPKERAGLKQLLRLFDGARHLHLESARLGSSMDKDDDLARFPDLPSLRHLELRGRLPDDDDDAAVDAVSRILQHAPKVEAVSLVFHPEEHDRGGCPDWGRIKEEELLDAHHLSFNPHSALAAASSVSVPRCLGRWVREVNLVHYQGGAAQRTLAKFLICNAPAIERVWCVFAEGPLWVQAQLLREIRGWVQNKSADTQFF